MKRLFSVGTHPARRAEAQHRAQLLIKRCVAIVSLTLALGGASEAAVDMTGDWYTAIDEGPVFLLHLVQTGTSLQASFGTVSGSGTINTTTGDFTLTLPAISPPADCGEQFNAQADMSGTTFIGTDTVIYTDPNCIGGIFTCACKASRTVELRGSRSCGNGVIDPGEQCDLGSKNGGPGLPNTTWACCTAMCQFAASGTLCEGVGTCNATGMCSCGNGVVDPGEQCDDGSANGTGGTCCAEDCQLLPSGTACTDDGDLCTEDVCVGFFDLCAHWAVPSGGCATPTVPGGASIVLQTRHGHNRAHFKWGKGPTVQLADFGNPGSEPTRLCIYEQPFGHYYLLVAGASPSVSGGGAWSQTSTGWKFKSRTGAPDGITGVTLKAGIVPSKAKVDVVAQGNPAFSVVSLSLAPGTVVQFKTSLGTCWEATFLTAIRSTATEFKAKSATPP